MPEKGTGCRLPRATNPYERSVLGFRADPRMRAFVEQNYLDEDLAQAVCRYARSEEFSRVCSILQPYFGSGSRLLDVGAGRGLTSLALAERGAHVISVEYDGSEVVGVGKLVRFVGARAIPLAPVRGDILHLPFSDKSFDAVFCRSVLHHLGDLGRGLRESYRVLRPGGVFLAVNEHILSPFDDGRHFLKAHPSVAYGVDERAYRPWVYTLKARGAGFRNVRLFGYAGDALDFPAFLEANGRLNPVRSRMMGLPLVGRLMARILHEMHVTARGRLGCYVTGRGTLCTVNLIAQKPSPPLRPARTRPAGNPAQVVEG
jgi:SAM-dependent methyltransferase